MKIKNYLSGSYYSIWSVRFIFWLFLIPLFLNSCNTKSKYVVVTFKGNGTVLNSSKSNIWVNSKADSTQSASLMVEKGDFLILNDNVLYFNHTEVTNFTFSTGKSFGYLNGKINTINISAKNNLQPWFKQMKDEDISGLQVLAIDDSLCKDYIPYLKQIAKTKPNVGICTDISNVPQFIKIFTPSFLLLENVKQNDILGLNNLKKLELLSISLDDTLYSIPLPAMPMLKQLIVSEMNANRTIGKDFLKNNPQIEHLVLMTKDSIDISFIQSIKNLKRLCISGFNSLPGISVIENYKNLETLCLIGENDRGLSSISKLHALRWLALPINTPQKEFNSIIEGNPNLEVLEIIKNDTISDLKPLQKLHKLIGLTITDTVTDNTTLPLLKQLKFLSVPSKCAADSNKMQNLRKQLPNCTIVTNEGFCLGTGWLLLLFPFILFLALFFRRKV
jgi:hypothetical protein